eukprot:CAMPEP_0181344628 /NCGR_PEP_ID=MMETSP1101-20121128/32276_1 /TAXON_ID=46948 /ORGANISM="Rhodomonas abbreviata, Strain Caron Lab Isolate" /LENGTH=75 /DNA_ID=CAMNT_0023456447 /DNA_START=24 /DNA_END=247 /DNA_ORIENTATION=-
MHKGCRIIILKTIAEAHGFLLPDGTGDIRHLGLAEILKAPTPFFLDRESGTIAGYITVDGILCLRCIGKAHTPCA